MARTPIYAAGGIVVRGHARPLIAVVQRSKDEAWVLPRGKLKRDENPVTGARREVVEETGHRVRVHEFLGAITYRARGRPKVVQFWRMQAYERPSRDIMKDIIAVDWLPLRQAVRQLSYPLEKLFLQHAGRRALKHRRHGMKRKRRTRRKTKAHHVRRPRKVRTRKVVTRGSAARKTGTRKSKTRARRPARARKTRTRLRRSPGLTTPRSSVRAFTAAPVRRPSVLQRMLGFGR
jgi:8-oxo-dGTP diphosphatase